MKITHIELYHIEIPLEKPFFSSWIPDYGITANKFTLMRLMTDTGLEGITTGVSYAGNTEGIGERLAYYFLGINPLDLDLVYQRMTEASLLKQRVFWVEGAIYDIIAKEKDVPVWKMLGGSDKEIPMYWSTGSVCNPKHHSKVIKKAQQQGYDGVKLRIRADFPKEDAKGISEARSLVDKAFPLMVDANQAFRWRKEAKEFVPLWTLDKAKQFVQGVADQNIRWLEEPLAMHNYEGLAALRESSSIPIAGAELHEGWHDVRMMLHFGSYDIYQPDVSFTGIQDTLKVYEETKKQGLGFTPHTWSNGVGLLTNMHLFSLTDRTIPFEYPHEPGSWTPEARDGILKEPIIPKDGLIELPQEAGMGISIDWDRVKKFGTKIYSST